MLSQSGPTPRLEPGPLPTVVVGGYLGAGKTTLVNHLLRHADGRRIAVMVNDFGEIGIDADLIESTDGDVLNLAGGCICCSVGSDLMEALMALPARAPRPDLVLIETSGVALPGSVAAAAGLARGIALEATVVVADARTVRERACDRYVGDTVLRQLREAQIILLNKTDQVDPVARAQVQAWLAETAPQAARVETERSAVPLELLFTSAIGAGSTPESIESPGPIDSPESPESPDSAKSWRPTPARRMAPANPATHRFVSATLRLNLPVDPESLARALAASRTGLVRAKGFVRDASGLWFSIQVVGASHEVTEAFEPAALSAQAHLAAAASHGYLVGIGLKGFFDPDHFDLDSLGIAS